LNDLVSNPNYEIYISYVVVQEIARCKDKAKQKKLEELLDWLNPQILQNTPEIVVLTQAIINQGVVTDKHEEDAFHIAFTLYHQLDYLVSWNYSHIVRTKTKKIVSILAVQEGYRNIEIISPREGL